MKITELLDAVKNAKGISTDYALAKTLGLPRARICDYYKGTRAPDEFACLKIADALNMPLDSVIATVKATSEKDEKRREAWENYMKRLGGVAAGFAMVVLCTVTMIVTSPYAEAAPLLKVSAGTFCIMLSVMAVLQLKSVLRRISEKSTFSVNIARVCQMAA